MKSKLALVVAVGFGAAIGIALQTRPALVQTPAFGGPDDVAYAKALWTELEKAKLVGGNAMHSNFYVGKEPHGAVLEVFDTDLTVADHTGRVVVKNNYGPAGATPAEVSADPAAHLGAITVMFRRESGYDTDDANWFWAKYLPDGSLDKNPLEEQLAGRVAKGTDQGCIACHSKAPGGDFLYVTDRPD